jgi:hypothetical protein
LKPRWKTGSVGHTAHITGPTVAGFLLGANRGDLFITMLVGGCGLLGLATLHLERVLPPEANGVVSERRGEAPDRASA